MSISTPASPGSAKGPCPATTIAGNAAHEAAAQESDAMPSTPSHASAPAVLELIGRTPLVKVTRFDTGPCTLFLKLESQNPGGSIKDRIGVAMIDAAERDGRLRPGGTVVEATASCWSFPTRWRPKRCCT